MSSRTWIVVVFDKDNAVEAIPKIWYHPEERKCYYPPNELSESQVLDYIKRRVMWEKSWPIYKVKILGREYDSYQLASCKARKALRSDDLTSTSEVEKGRGMRLKKKKQVVYGNDESSFSSSQENDDESDDGCSFPSPPIRKSAEPRVRHIGNGAPQINKTLSQNYYKKNLEASTSERASSESQARYISNGAPQMNKTFATNEETLRQLTQEMREFQKQTIRLLNIVNGKLSQQSESLEMLTNEIIHKKNRNTNLDAEDTMEINEYLSLLPLDDLIDVQNFDKLITEQKLEDSLAKEFSRTGGDDPKKITKRIMYRIFSNKAGQCYSFEGAKGKEVFKNLKLYSVIIKAVRLNKKTENASDSDIIETIKAWLAQAKNRLKNKRVTNDGATTNL